MSDLEIQFFGVGGLLSLVVSVITYVRGKVLQGGFVGAFGLAFIWSIIIALLEASRKTKSDAPIPDGFFEIVFGAIGFLVGGVVGTLAGALGSRRRSK